MNAGRPSPAENDLSNEPRFREGDHLRDHAAHREAKKIDLIESQCADESTTLGSQAV
jgi:hypothetical protein